LIALQRASGHDKRLRDYSDDAMILQASLSLTIPPSNSDVRLSQAGPWISSISHAIIDSLIGKLPTRMQAK
jgi:hypothetical protein